MLQLYSYILVNRIQEEIEKEILEHYMVFMSDNNLHNLKKLLRFTPHIEQDIACC